MDGNGQLSMRDVTLALRIGADLSSAGADEVLRGDLHGPNGRITPTDAAALLRALL